MPSGLATPAAPIASGCSDTPCCSSIGLLAVGSAWLALWLVYVVFAIRYFPRVQTAQKS